MGPALRPVPVAAGKGAARQLIRSPSRVGSLTPYLVPTPRDLPLSWTRELADAFLNVLYPQSCFICNAPVVHQRECGVCGNCWHRALQLRITSPWCACCGLPVLGFDPGSGHLCSDCITDPPAFSAARSYGYYQAELSRIVQQLKFRGARNLVGLLGPLMASAFLDSWKRDEIDLIVPVPLHKKRRRERGFNQSELLASSIGTILAIPVRHGAVRRIRQTAPQVGLSDSERVDNVRGAFDCTRPAEIRGGRVLLVDDVMTTGATVRSVVQAIVRAGAARVSVLTLARAVPHS